jgi:DNA polymerase I-like protein with 3'-5' exonuclease and polymerase domains
MPRFRSYKWEAMADTCWARFLADRPSHIAIDTETSGLTWQDEPFGMTVAWTRPSGDIETGWLELGNELGLQRAREIISVHASDMMLDPDEPFPIHGQFIFFNAKFDIRMLTNYGLWLPGVLYEYVDVLPMVALLKPVGEHKLKTAMREYLKIDTHQERALERVIKKLKLTKKTVSYKTLPRDVIVPYALMDAEGTLRLHDKLRPMITARGLDVPFEKEMRLVGVMLHMERRGLLTVPDRTKEAVKLCDENMAAATAEVEALTGHKVGKATKKVKVERGLSKNPKTPDRMLYKTIEVPDDFNIGAWQQIVEMFNSRGHKITSSRSAVLEKLDDPLVAPLFTLRSEKKLRDYLMAILKEADSKNIVHPNFNQFGTGTGRFSSGAVK